MAKSLEESLKILMSGVEQVLPKDGLTKKLEKKKILKVKLGFDPTAPDVHLGHAVVLKKLKQFQDLGHEIIFLIGDFTAKIGDPSGKSKTRPPLSSEQIKENAKTYFEQVGKIVDSKKTTIRYNSEWLSKMDFEEVLKLAGKVTLARLVERDDFQKRLKENLPIGLHELFYPVMQGYDSVALEADVELGGTDQTFNLLMGRVLQEQFDQTPQVSITMPILEGLDGVQKMSKSLGNYVGLNEDPREAYCKLMSISDKLMWRYLKLLLAKSDSDIKSMQRGVESSKLHPMQIKKQMAFDIVKEFWSEERAGEGQEKFEALFQNKDYSKATEVKFSQNFANPVWIVELLKEIGAIKTSSEARRLLESGSVSIDDNVIKDFKSEVSWVVGMTIKVGKHRIYKIG
ncbi:tyrosine--tRNA ligase [Candidatus Babeliales bacterium]|nr:tyrosine--tRNA ligase [Candidatus Babeliales bacterium]